MEKSNGCRLFGWAGCAIGSFISGSGIDDSWIAVGWYDGQCLVRPGIRMF